MKPQRANRWPWLAIALVLGGTASHNSSVAAAEPDAQSEPEQNAEADGSHMLVPADAGRRLESAPFELPSDAVGKTFEQSTQGLQAWFAALAPVEPGESFGSVIIRAGRLVLGRPYAHTVEVPGQEVVDCNVSVFQCVSFVESSLAMARCAWSKERTPACFRREVSRLRYRHGTIDGFASRLHYFEDWLDDNASRGSLMLLTEQLSRHHLLRRTAYMTHHPDAFPAMRDPLERRRIEATERRLSHKPVPVVFRDDIAGIASQLQDGDIVAIVTRRPDILIRHAGLIDRDSQNTIRLLHASSAHGKVMRTHETLSSYMYHRPEREGILIARPIAPGATAVVPTGKRKAPAPAAPPAAVHRSKRLRLPSPQP